MKIFLEFHEKDKSINTADFLMDAEQITALLNSEIVLWPFEEEGRNRYGKIYESNFNPFENLLLVKLQEVVKSEGPTYSF